MSDFETATPRPYSRSFVLHLDSWYAQSHPAEDFAETFAVWLTPNSDWRKRYTGWPALKKLEYMDALMTQIARREPLETTRRVVSPLHHLTRTLREHYRRKRKRYGLDHPSFYDRDLRRLFHTGSSTTRSHCRTGGSLLGGDTVREGMTQVGY